MCQLEQQTDLASKRHLNSDSPYTKLYVTGVLIDYSTETNTIEILLCLF